MTPLQKSKLSKANASFRICNFPNSAKGSKNLDVKMIDTEENFGRKILILHLIRFLKIRNLLNTKRSRLMSILIHASGTDLGWSRFAKSIKLQNLPTNVFDKKLN